MTVRTRRPERVGVRARLGGMVDTEEHQQALLTVLFIGTIIAVALIIFGALGVNWYNDNLRAVGKVGSQEISPQMLRDSVNLEQWRISRDEGRITQAQIDGTLDTATANSKNAALDSQSQNLSTTALDSLVDSIYQSQLAPANGVNVTSADIDARYQQEISSAEQRHVYQITVVPQAADTTNGPTTAERQAALDKADQALADLNAGKDFAQVAQTYGTDAKSQAGGDLGMVSQLAISDDTFGKELFALPLNGTTGIIAGADGTYRIGRVTEITPGTVDNALKNKLLGSVSEQSVRQLLGFEVAAENLQDKIVGDAVSQSPEQSKLAVIYIEGASGDSTDTNAADGEIDYSEIVFAPNNNLDAAPDLSPDDPAWAAAKTEADAAYAQLQAITDVDQRTTQFTSMATSNSDDPTSSDGGKVGYVTRDIPPQAVSDALWGGTFNKGDVIGPIKGDAGYYVLMFNNKRASADDRVKSVQDALAQPNADFNAIAKQWSDGPEAADGGELGWFTKDGLSTAIADQVWALAVGQVSDPIELGQGRYIVKVEDRATRALDADQQATARQNAFDTWYQPQKDQASTDGTITTIAPLSSGGDLTGGGDQPTP
jgi:parvulin-like peptidyl-prolyl isomerase